ncbi:putative MPP superfamily phosphohydrolase [Variovorax boronicumulans]|uniref:MPP superfamily phosphohydrolase n=1 Tax=Variovorax boronicumulans TaxID=436515 RepID=A0AAW8CXX9_9BURK|nr:metallophosphoesterase [Variovorax boronicumulans]MDP9892789.1 putative MPP superfamily phosphohydrolase [Variovorax boronicumulans]MDQ0051729.1 putative MPP superfamily phosphohydrolase [Variovorax boronicumulans]
MRTGAGRRGPRVRIAAAVLLLALAVWTVVIEPRWVAARVEPLGSAQWQPPAGLKVAMAGDWHLTTRSAWRVTSAERAARIVEDINAAQPDVILLPGDFLAGSGDDEAFSIEDMAAVLGRLKAPQGVYAVLGNHDWWHDGERTAKALAAQGIHVLENASVRLPGHDLWVVGIGDDSTGHSEADKALAGVPKGAATLVMMHDPFSFATMPRTQGLVVASHTHGGQISVPGYGALVVPGRAPREWAYGWVAHKGNRMYVTSGLGVSILPVRFNMRPEWVMFQ